MWWRRHDPQRRAEAPHRRKSGFAGIGGLGTELPAHGQKNEVAMTALTIVRDRPLCDGTPRREKGWRAVWRHTSTPDGTAPFRCGVYLQSPLFRSSDRIRTWARFVDAALTDGADPEAVSARWDAFAARHPERQRAP